FTQQASWWKIETIGNAWHHIRRDVVGSPRNLDALPALRNAVIREGATNSVRDIAPKIGKGVGRWLRIPLHDASRVGVEAALVGNVGFVELDHHVHIAVAANIR